MGTAAVYLSTEIHNLVNNNNKSIFKVQNLVPSRLETILSAYTCTHTHKHSDYTKLNIHSLKRAANTQEICSVQLRSVSVHNNR